MSYTLRNLVFGLINNDNLLGGNDRILYDGINTIQAGFKRKLTELEGFINANDISSQQADLLLTDRVLALESVVPTTDVEDRVVVLESSLILNKSADTALTTTVANISSSLSQNGVLDTALAAKVNQIQISLTDNGVLDTALTTRVNTISSGYFPKDSPLLATLRWAGANLSYQSVKPSAVASFSIGNRFAPDYVLALQSGADYKSALISAPLGPLTLTSRLGVLGLGDNGDLTVSHGINFGDVGRLQTTETTGVEKLNFINNDNLKDFHVSFDNQDSVDAGLVSAFKIISHSYAQGVANQGKTSLFKGNGSLEIVAPVINIKSSNFLVNGESYNPAGSGTAYISPYVHFKTTLVRPKSVSASTILVWTIYDVVSPGDYSWTYEVIRPAQNAPSRLDSSLVDDFTILPDNPLQILHRGTKFHICTDDGVNQSLQLQITGIKSSSIQQLGSGTPYAIAYP